jgi:tetratricopeptide (TPR) repeat protein
MMAIGFFLSHGRLFGVALAAAILVLPAKADDQLKRKDGTIITGQIQGVSNGQVMVKSRTANGGEVRLPYYLSDIQSVDMAPPAAYTGLKDAAPAAVIAALEPLVKQYAGLPTDWVVEAMAKLADAYAVQNQSAKALEICNQIDTLYPGSKYHLQAVAIKARMSLQQGKPAEAIAAVKPIIDEANQNLAPSQAEGGLYATAFLVYGQALEAQKQNPQALEAYLTVKTMFYQNPALAEQADQLAKKLREQNPGLGVD